MSFMDDIDILRTYIPWISPTIKQDTWKLMNYKGKIKSLMYDIIEHAHEIGYINFDIKTLAHSTLAIKDMLFDADKRIYLRHILNETNTEYALMLFVGSNDILFTDSLGRDTLIKYINGKYRFVSEKYEPRVLFAGLAPHIITTDFNKFLYKLLISYFALTSSYDFENADHEGRKRMIDYTVESLLREQQRKPVISWAKNRTYPTWFTPPSEDPDTWYEAIEEVNDQLLELLLSKEPKINREGIRKKVKKLLSTGHYILSQRIYSLVPHFMYRQIGKGILAIEIKDGKIMLSGYDASTLHRVYTEYLPWKKYNSSDIIWDDDLFDGLLEFYALE